ncbi:hypothetical protein PIB30_103644 [Stylosanthes scabra]|uniref:Uncharacterized protein n=1 Tax=Stylosanthes scabra TaxID=79078 RepID=A0ABU6R0Q1_9FABA|nr:hypothetical protein [Stylosanthes scabra]
MMELVDSFHIPDSTIRTNIGRFKVDATKVGHALGLNATGGLYRQKMLKKEVPPEQYEAVDKYRKKSLADLRDMVTQIQLDTEEGITNFKRAFILVGIIERRTKKRHEAINAAPLQPPRQGEADANPDATINALPDPSTQVNVNQEDHNKDANSAFAMMVEEDDTQHNAVIVDETIATAPPKDTVPASEEEVTPIFDASIAEPSRMTATRVESAEEENTHQNAMLVDAAIEMAPPKNILTASEEEDVSIASVLTNLVERITTHPNVELEKNLEESVTRPEEEASEQELTFRDLSETQKATSLQKQPMIVLALEKAGEKESVAVPRELEKAEPTQRDLADSGEYLNFTPPSFKLLSSQDEPQQEEIRGEEVKAVGPVNEPSSQEFEE